MLSEIMSTKNKKYRRREHQAFFNNVGREFLI